MRHSLFLSFLLCLMLHDVLLINGMENIPRLSWEPWGTSNLAQPSKVIKDNQPKMQGVCGTPDSKLYLREVGARHPAKSSYLHLTLWCPGFRGSNPPELAEDVTPENSIRELVDSVLFGERKKNKTNQSAGPAQQNPFPLWLFADYLFPAPEKRLNRQRWREDKNNDNLKIFLKPTRKVFFWNNSQ